MNFGIKNEYDIVNYLNGKCYYQLNESWRKSLLKIYPNISESDSIVCFKIEGTEKPDIFISVNNVKHYISVKIGYSVSPHREKMEYFYSFLKSIGLNDYDIETLKYYHFGDNTLNGRGHIRYPVEEVKRMYKSRIRKLNNKINQDVYLKPIFNRMLVSGSEKNVLKAEYLYLGSDKEGRMVSMSELIDYLCNTKSFYLDSIHFGPFIYAPGYRGLTNFDPRKSDRYYVCIKWTTVIDDMAYLHGEVTDYKKKFLLLEENKNKLRNNIIGKIIKYFKNLFKK